MEFSLLSEAEARSPALSLSDAGTPHPALPEHGCKGQEHSGERAPFWGWGEITAPSLNRVGPGDGSPKASEGPAAQVLEPGNPLRRGRAVTCPHPCPQTQRRPRLRCPEAPPKTAR